MQAYFYCGWLSKLFTNFLRYKGNRKVLNLRKVCWNNFLTSQRLTLLYYFLKGKTAILENIMLIFFTSFDVTIYFHIKKHVCIIYAWIVHRWIVKRWIVYCELAEPYPNREVSNQLLSWSCFYCPNLITVAPLELEIKRFLTWL